MIEHGFTEVDQLSETPADVRGEYFFNANAPEVTRTQARAGAKALGLNLPAAGVLSGVSVIDAECWDWGEQNGHAEACLAGFLAKCGVTFEGDQPILAPDWQARMMGALFEVQALIEEDGHIEE